MALAQEVPLGAEEILTITVTGSHIPRSEQETSLPVQVITRAEIERGNWTTAAEVMAHVSANFNGFNNQLSIGQAGRPGLSSANLRGLGDGNTLVLLNGRRLANYAFLSGTVNLNTIPVAALDRVEILKDGASSIYGADAIAGVVNFITRGDYNSTEVTGETGATQHGGGDHYQATVTAGFGSLVKDKFNAFITVDWQKDTALAARDRAFSKTAYLPAAGINALSGATLPANIVFGGAVLNPSYTAGCAPPTSLPYIVNGNPICGFDYASVIDIAPPVEQTNVIARGTYALAANHFLVGELVYSHSNTVLRVTPSPSFMGMYPETGPYYPVTFAVDNGLTGDLNVLYRTIPLGPRTDEVVTQAWRTLVGLEGTTLQWRYDAAYVHSENTATDTFRSGYVSRSQFNAAMATGLINPFGASGAAGDALLQSTQIPAQSRTAKGTMDGIDARASANVYALAAGPLALAIGAEARREHLRDQPTRVQDENDVLGMPQAIDPQSASRTAGALFAELNIPITRTIDAQVSARYDRYSDFGGTTNPKIALSWLPVKSLLVRGSWGTGFRAPSLPDLHTPQSMSMTGASDDLVDPLRCPVTGLPRDCGLGPYGVLVGGNPALVPETSTQWSVGLVWEPVAGVSIGIDYWNIRKWNVINALYDGLILGNYDVYGQTHVIRGPPDAEYPGLPGPIETLIEYNENVGNQQTAGIDVSLRAQSRTTSHGRFTFRLDGSYVDRWIDSLNGVPSTPYAGGYSPFGPVPRWRHYASLEWGQGPWQATIGQTFQSGYTDAEPDVDGNPRRVGAYSIWDLQGTYSGWRNTSIALGVKNIFDRAPPFTNQRGLQQIGYDPSYANPLGRMFYLQLMYAFN